MANNIKFTHHVSSHECIHQAKRKIIDKLFWRKHYTRPGLRPGCGGLLSSETLSRYTLERSSYDDVLIWLGPFTVTLAWLCKWSKFDGNVMVSFSFLYVQVICVVFQSWYCASFFILKKIQLVWLLWLKTPTYTLHFT